MSEAASMVFLGVGGSSNCLPYHLPLPSRQVRVDQSQFRRGSRHPTPAPRITTIFWGGIRSSSSFKALQLDFSQIHCIDCHHELESTHITMWIFIFRLFLAQNLCGTWTVKLVFAPNTAIHSTPTLACALITIIQYRGLP